VLHNRRKRLRELAEKEAAGTSFWTDKFGGTVRTKILHALSDSAGQYGVATACEIARGQILRDEGLQYLANRTTNPANDFVTYLMTCPDSMVPTVIEAAAVILNDYSFQNKVAFKYDTGEVFRARIEEILREHRISFELINGEMVEFSSRELHSEVVAPALSLLAGDQAWKRVEAAYRDALEEISKGKAGDAITDAGTALQVALVVVGCEGNALGPLIKSARNKGLLAPHDSPMLDAIEKLLSWVSADRSQSGDSHSSSEATIDDAWLIVHVVGAIILRISKGTRR